MGALPTLMCSARKSDVNMSFPRVLLGILFVLPVLLVVGLKFTPSFGMYCLVLKTEAEVNSSGWSGM